MKLALAITTPEVPISIPVALLTGTFEQRLAKARALGCDGVELMASRPGELDSVRIREMVAWEGLSVAAVSSGAVAAVDRITLLARGRQTRKEARTRLEALVDFAAVVQAPVLTLGSFRGRLDGIRDVDARRHFRDVLSAGLDQAARVSIRLVLEPLNRYETDFIHTCADALDLITQIDHPQLGILLDTFHMNIEEASPLEAVRQALAAGKLWHVHLSDSNRLPPGQGHFDFPGLLTLLREQNYAGFLSAELMSRPDWDTAAAAPVQAFRDWMVWLDG